MKQQARTTKERVADLMDRTRFLDSTLSAETKELLKDMAAELENLLKENMRLRAAVLKTAAGQTSMSTKLSEALRE